MAWLAYYYSGDGAGVTSLWQDVSGQRQEALNLGMDIQQLYSIEIRAEGSDKTLVLIDGLTEAEADKVFKRITFPTRGKGYEKLYIFKEIIMRRKSLEGK